MCDKGNSRNLNCYNIFSNMYIKIRAYIFWSTIFLLELYPIEITWQYSYIIAFNTNTWKCCKSQTIVDKLWYIHVKKYYLTMNMIFKCSLTWKNSLKIMSNQKSRFHNSIYNSISFESILKDTYHSAILITFTSMYFLLSFSFGKSFIGVKDICK